MKTNSIIRLVLVTVLVTSLSIFQHVHAQAPANDNCSGAVSLTSGASCINTAGTFNNATISPGIPASCASGNLYDVWYSFVANGVNQTITISGFGTSFTRRQLVVYEGSCGGLVPVSLLCSGVQTSGASLALSSNDFSPGTTYFVQVIFNNTAATPITTNGGFQICVTGSSAANSPSLQFGKSYSNTSKPAGGVIQTNDVLEFRSAISVTNGTIYNVVYSDTIPAGMSYIPNSIKFSTNEGLKYQSGITGLVNLTDASGDDEAVVSGNVLRVNVGSLTRSSSGQSVFQAYPATTPITTASYGGGKIRSNGRPSFYLGTAIIMVTYQARVMAATGTIFTTGNGAFRYKITTADPNDGSFPQSVNFLTKFSIYVSAGNTLCQSAVGLNNYTGGDFGSGNKRHDSTQLTIAPGYTWKPFASNAPQDGEFNVANNTSVNLSTNKYQPYTNSAIRVFGWWDVIGDHTNATNVDSGNFAVPYGTTGGYMAVVNAAYGINNAVQKTINGLCTDTYYEFTSWFKNICIGCSCDTAGRGVTNASFKNYKPGPKNMDDSAGVTPDLTFQVDGVDYYTTGSIPYNKIWMKKGFLFKTGASQTTATLTIRNNAPGGGGNDWVMDDITLGTCLPTLQLRPGLNPSYCLNAQIDLSAVVTSFYPNYTFYEWERSTDGGATWGSAPEMPGIKNYTYTYDGTSYKDTVAIPSFLSVAANNGYKYRVKTATSAANLSNSGCSVYNTAQIVTLNIWSTCNVLPVEILNFNVSVENEYGILNWVSKGEENLLRYDAEKSTDGVNFKKMGAVTARNSAVSEQSYSFTDPEVINGKVYYRLKMIANGNTTSKYSNVLNVSAASAKRFELTNVVNPFVSQLKYQINAPFAEEMEAQLLDIAGRFVTSQKISVHKGVNALVMEAPSSLQKGTYLLRIKTSNGYLYQMIQSK
ncbi:MAG: T9SS type A sorting domain-containing protein [Chitinophagaceae bacterium]|nr:T9SS type A sorting domain-containing protein [Chitinophagaceae bacterium]